MTPWIVIMAQWVAIVCLWLRTHHAERHLAESERQVDMLERGRALLKARLGEGPLPRPSRLGEWK